MRRNGGGDSDIRHGILAPPALRSTAIPRIHEWLTVEDFTAHDWHHPWASHCVMAGIDFITIMNTGGWKSLRMVQRYSSVSVDHMRDSINKLS